MGTAGILTPTPMAGFGASADAVAAALRPLSPAAAFSTEVVLPTDGGPVASSGA
jgi:hypothetical protein